MADTTPASGRNRRFTIVIASATILATALCVASWLKGDLTRNDFERFDDLRLTFTFFALFTAAVGGYVGLVEQPGAPNRRFLLIGLLLMALPLIASFPIGSRDVFAYAFYPKMWAEYGINPYLKAPSTASGDPWFPMLQAWWRDHPTAYGPFFTWQSRAVYALAGRSLTTVVATYKLLNLPLLLLSGWLLLELRREVSGDHEPAAEDRSLALWLWCPLVLFESLGSGHNDLMMVLLIQAAALTWVRGRWMAAGALLATSFWYKLYTVVLLPLWLVWWIRRSGKHTLTQIGLAVAAAVVVSLVAVLPFWGELGPIVDSLRGHEVVRLIFPSEMPPPVWLLFRLLLATGALETDSGLTGFMALRLGAFATAMGWLILRSRAQSYSPAGFVADCFWSLLLFVSLVPTVLYPWHLLGLCPLALALGGRRYERGVALISTVGLLSYFLTFVWALLLCALIVAALAFLRRGSRSQPS